ncbi:carbohydrate esterase family 4 protein [Botryobasidium botryosum FD-172 SS1]|uniref:chitin deacetylase n=1 Tax=Botryobasidium botryosum (strain FD-172 SS1) TaxID=930990 RepID=A0A067MPH0_BOTB1|nr:carbohydrate esterase family 4 protein [Botryobasidium botryosum FD-172 SS1]
MARAGTLFLLASFGVIVVSAGNWHHPRDHPVYDLFKRQNASAGALPAIGSAQWNSTYPEDISNATVPDAWMAAYTTAKAAGLIPNISLTTVGADGVPAYPAGDDPNSAEICSGTYQCRINGTTTEIWDAPDGHVGLGFDDGPLPYSPPLCDFLKQQGQTATHFYIGTNILQNPFVFQGCMEDPLQTPAVHTWTHPYMTTKTDEQVLLELGWTMQIIHDSLGGRLPRFWRPPYGDTDTRVTAIAYYVYHLTTVVWNQDTNDWMLEDPTDNPDNVITNQTVITNLTNWLSGPKTPGLIILEHELSSSAVQCFIQTYPLHAQNGWITGSIPDTFDQAAFLNSWNATSPVTPLDIAATPPSSVGPPAAPAAATTAVAAGASASSGASVAAGASKSTSNNSSNGAGSIAAISTAALLGAALCTLVFSY